MFLAGLDLIPHLHPMSRLGAGGVRGDARKPDRLRSGAPQLELFCAPSQLGITC